jgi:hypothetical protein
VTRRAAREVEFVQQQQQQQQYQLPVWSQNVVPPWPQQQLQHTPYVQQQQCWGHPPQLSQQPPQYWTPHSALQQQQQQAPAWPSVPWHAAHCPRCDADLIDPRVCGECGLAIAVARPAPMQQRQQTQQMQQQSQTLPLASPLGAHALLDESERVPPSQLTSARASASFEQFAFVKSGAQRAQHKKSSKTSKSS